LHRARTANSVPEATDIYLGIFRRPLHGAPHKLRQATMAPAQAAEGQSVSGAKNKLLEQVIRTPGRMPSPQPVHLNVPGIPHSRVLQEDGPGYVAPKFEGKEQQMETCVMP
jgi:hypothetical protein